MSFISLSVDICSLKYKFYSTNSKIRGIILNHLKKYLIYIY